jgi:NAD(P)-dependent dehydrogenase (short-subunit alcohol dehydrogenase family)
MKLKGEIAVVTGASTGIGRAIAEAIAANGGQVALVARSVNRLQETKSLIQGAGGEARIFPTDLRDEKAINNLASDVLETWGDIDILVHTAGVWHNDNSVYEGVPLVDMPAERINEGLDVQIRAPMLLTRLFLPGMIRKKRGKILSITGTFERGGVSWLDYYVSKLALEHFTIGLARELREHEIQVNAISPSFTATEAACKFFPEDVKTAISPAEVAKLAIFLLSKDADNISGQSIVIKNKAEHRWSVLTPASKE